MSSTIASKPTHHLFKVILRQRCKIPYSSLSEKNTKSAVTVPREPSMENEKLNEVPSSKAPVEPEEPTTCCMSGCANCVWLEYAEKLAEYYKDGGEKAVKEINSKISDPNIKAYLMHEIRMREAKKE